MATEYLSNKFLEDAILRFKSSKQDRIRYLLLMEDIKSSSEKRIKHKKQPFYEISVYQSLYDSANSKYEQSKCDLANSFMTLSQHLVRYAKDIIVDPDDAVQEGVMICFEKIDRFDPNFVGKNDQKAKAFNYMTTCVLNHFRQIYRTDKNYRELKERFKLFMASRMNGVSI
jgi:hypothetical protein